MAPPPRQSQADDSTEFNRKKALGPADHQQEHGKTRRNNSKSRANPQIDIIEVGSFSSSDSASLGKRSPEPEAREPMGGAELQRPPKFFHEDNGLKGLAGPPPAAVPNGETKEEDGKETVFLQFLKKGDKKPLPDRGSHFFKTGTTGSIPMDDSACGHGLEKRGEECVPALEKRTDKTEDRAEVAAEVKPEVSEVTEKDWNDAIHGAVQWTVENKIKPALEDSFNAEQIEGIPEGLAADLASTNCAEGQQLELTEAEIATLAEEMVKAYYAEHPEARAEVLTALGELANEQRVTGNTTPMSQHVQEVTTLNDAAGLLNTKRSVHEIVNEYGKGKNLWKPKKLELWKEAGFDGYPSPPEIDLEEAKIQAAACEVLHGAPIKKEHNHRIVPSLKWDTAAKKVKEYTSLSLDKIVKKPVPEQPGREAAPPPLPAPMNLDTRNSISHEARPCIVKSGVKFSNCGGILKHNGIEKGALDWKGVDKHDEKDYVPEETIRKRTVGIDNGVGFRKGALDWQGVPVGEYERAAHLHTVVNKWGKGKNHYDPEFEKEPAPEKGRGEGGIRLPEDGFVEGSVDPNEVGTEPADPDALFQNLAPQPELEQEQPQEQPQDQQPEQQEQQPEEQEPEQEPEQQPKHSLEDHEWTKGIDKHDENDGVPEQPAKRSLYETINEYGKGAKHYKQCHLDPADECGFTGYGPTEPIDLEEAAMQAPADEALLRSTIVSPHSADDISAIHRLPPAKEGPEIDLEEAKMQAAADANLRHDRIENVKEEDRHVEDDEWTKGIEKHDENDGVPEEPSRDAPAPPTNAIPRHAKRAPIDIEDWRTDGQDEVDVKFSQRFGEAGSGKHHKDKDGHHHKGDKQHSKSHHEASTAHHSKSHHATSAGHSTSPGPTESVHTRSFSAPARAPGHALPTSRVGGYKFSQAAGRSPAADTAPTTSIKGHMHGAKPTHTAAVSGKTTAAPTQKHAEATETGSIKNFKVDKVVSYAHAQATHAANVKAADKALVAAESYEHITIHREPVADDYRAFDKFNAATLNSVDPDSSTAQLLAESEKAAVELNHGTAKSNTDRKKEGSSGNKFGKRVEGKPDGNLGVVINPGNNFDVDKMTTLGKSRNKSWHPYQKNIEWNVKKAQEKDMYRVASKIGQENGHEAEVVSQQEPIIRGHDLAAIQASNGHDKGAETWWGRVKHALHNNKGSKLGEENEKARKEKQMKNSFRHKPVLRQMGDNRAEHKEPKSKIWDGDNDKLEGIYMNLGDANNKEKKEEGSKLGKRHSHIPQVKEEEDAKMRGYASSRHLAGAAAKKDRQKAAEKVNEIAKKLEEDREALHAAAEHRADRLMAQAEREEAAAKKGKGKGKEYFDHDTYDPIKAHIAEDEEEMEEDDREGSWTDVVGGELVEHNHHDSGNKFADYKLGSASATGLPGVRGAIADKASEMSDLSMVIVIGAWIAILFAILKLARKKSEAETGWLKGRRPGSGRAEEGFLEDMEEGGVEKRYD